MGKPKNVILHEVFDIFDSNSDGFVDATELKAAFEGIGDDHITLAHCELLVSRIDKDGNGAIDFKEFKKMWKKYLKDHQGVTPLVFHTSKSILQSKGKEPAAGVETDPNPERKPRASRIMDFLTKSSRRSTSTPPQSNSETSSRIAS